MKLPVFIENSKVPVWLSKLSPIEIGAITLGPLVFSRETMSDRVKNHEAIHWEQYKECLIVGFLLLYGAFWLISRIKFRDGTLAYYQNPFEIEAYENDHDFSYVKKRKFWAWSKYIF